MKKQFPATLSTLSFLLMLTAATASAQSPRTTKGIKVPFNFIVGEKTLPAGEYRFEPNSGDFDKVWLIQGRDGHASVFIITMRAQADKTQENAWLVFHKYGDQYFLSQIWVAGGSTGRELLMPRLERELAGDVIKRRTVVLTSARRN